MTKKKKKALSFQELLKKNLKCPFCGASSKKAEGGYVSNKFLCRKCQNKITETASLLEGRT